MFLDIQFLHTVEDKAAAILSDILLGCMPPSVANQPHKIGTKNGSPPVNNRALNLIVDHIHHIQFLSLAPQLM